MKSVKHNLIVFGTGYVGLVTGTCFAEMGLNVICVDNNQEKINLLSSGRIPIHEPHLKEMIDHNTKADRLSFQLDSQCNVDIADFIIIAVGTPGHEDGSVDTSDVFNVAKLLGKQIHSDKIVIIKSTVPLGTAEQVKNIIYSQLKERNLEHLKITIVSNPEFLKEGAAVEDFMKPDRIIIGIDSPEFLPNLEGLYKPFSRLGNKIITMSTRSAELAKYAANAMLALRISFMNELSQLCEYENADIEDIRKAIGSDHRIGKHFLYAGIGYGGSCFPKDTRALYHLGFKNDLELSIISSIIKVNHNQLTRFVNKIITTFSNNIGGKIFSILGVSFKPDTNDYRNSPSLFIMNELSNLNAKVKLYDPIVTTNEENREELTKLENDNILFCKSLPECVQDSSCLILCTEWHEFRMLNFELLSLQMQDKYFFDGRNQYLKQDVENFGFKYYGIGRV